MFEVVKLKLKMYFLMMRNIAQGVTGGGIKTDPVTNIVEMTPQFTCKHPYTYLY